MRLLTIFFTFFLFGCTESSDSNKLVKGLVKLGHYTASEELKGTICYSPFRLGYKIDVEKCLIHDKSPKFKIGQKIRLKENAVFSDSCKFYIFGREWSGYANEPWYWVSGICPGGHEEFHEKFSEKELKK